MNYLPATSGVSQGTSLSGTRVDATHPEPRADAAQAPAVPRRRGRSLSVGQKLAASFGILGLAVALLGATTWMTGEGTGRQAALLTAEQLPIERSVRDWKTQSVAIGQIALRATLSSDVFPLVAEMRTQLAAEDALRKRDIPYRIYGGLSFYQRKEIKDVLAYLRLVINPKD